VYDVAGTIASILLLNYAVIPFVLLDVRDSLQGWRSVHWYGHVMVFGVLVFFWAGGETALKKKQEKRIAAEEHLRVLATPDFEASHTSLPNGSGPATPGAPVVAPVHIAENAVKKRI